MELAGALDAAWSGSLTMAPIAHVLPIGYVANLLGEDENWLCDLSTDMRYRRSIAGRSTPSC